MKDLKIVLIKELRITLSRYLNERSKNYLIKVATLIKYLKIVLIKDLKSTLSRYLNKRQGPKKKYLIKEPYQRPKKVPYQRSKKCLIKLV